MKIKCVLLIDDNPIDSFINKHIVTKCNKADCVIVKNSALDALDYLKDKNNLAPEVIFLDIQMPIIDGFGFLEEYELYAKTENIKSAIVMVSSSNNPEDIEKANNNCYVIKYLNKPLTTQKIEAVLNNL